MQTLELLRSRAGTAKTRLAIFSAQGDFGSAMASAQQSATVGLPDKEGSCISRNWNRSSDYLAQEVSTNLGEFTMGDDENTLALTLNADD